MKKVSKNKHNFEKSKIYKIMVLMFFFCLLNVKKLLRNAKLVPYFVNN